MNQNVFISSQRIRSFYSFQKTENQVLILRFSDLLLSFDKYSIKLVQIDIKLEQRSANQPKITKATYQISKWIKFSNWNENDFTLNQRAEKTIS